MPVVMLIILAVELRGDTEVAETELASETSSLS